ncbi:gas vesicle protein GvpN [Myxacorys almedinensis]|uniref:Gas vesicle protein GvpN n=1 Tax=Myxacorys almedinensis A TaxID=2690445 RepID=A0A8J8CKE1_9CYAN|nr:gas vesicle protein GvpN [Myxacorys almedinensis A]
MTTVLRASPRRFVSTPPVERLARRALRYLQSGFSVHLRGPAGTGKTTLALHLADLLARPMMLIYGDDESRSSDLIGAQSGYTRKKVVDNFIHSVVKVEDELKHNWVDSRLTMACREGFTLVYDEFNRSRPEVNNVLLSALEEKLLVLPPTSNQTEYVRVNSNFRAILTSNSEEYCGVHGTQDALMDRLVTIIMPEPDELTQQEILIQKTSLDRASASLIVQLVSTFRTQSGLVKSSGLRSSVVIAKVCQEHNILVSPDDTDFREICSDVLLSRSGLPFHKATELLWQLISALKTNESAEQANENAKSNIPSVAIEALTDKTEIDFEEITESKQIESFRQESNVERSIELTLNEQLSELLKEIPTTQDESQEGDFQNSEEQRIYQYLTHTDGAGLSDLESEFSMSRTQVLDTIRSMTRSGQVTHRDRKFFAVVRSEVKA